MTKSKEELRKLVQQIKMAEPFTGNIDPITPGDRPAPPPVGGGPAPAPGEGGSVGRGRQAGPIGNPNVKKMQEAMINLAREVTAQLNVRNLTSGNPRQQTEAGGRDSFGDFLTKHFMRNSNVPAVEFSPDPTKNNMQDKDPRIASKMSWVMDTMARIGGATNEFTADGIWGPRTAAALDNIAAFVNGLFALSEAFNVNSNFYTKDYLKELEQVAEEQDDADASVKAENAPTMANHINAIRKMYEEIKNKVLQLPQYQTYIEQDTPYLQYEKKTSFTPNTEQIASMRQLFPQGFNIVINNLDTLGKDATVKLTVDDMAAGADKFSHWVRAHGAGDPGAVLQQVTQQLDQMEQA